MGRNTNGGLEITSKPFSVVPTGVALGVTVGLTSGEALGDALGEGEGEGVGGPLMVKLAHGLGATLAQRRCTPDPSPENGLTRVLKLPLASAVADPATLLVVSQYSDSCSFGRN